MADSNPPAGPPTRLSALGRAGLATAALALPAPAAPAVPAAPALAPFVFRASGRSEAAPRPYVAIANKADA